MGNVTAKTSGEIANFMIPAKTNIKSFKVHFSPKQLGTGDPSPENVREIVGWDGVEVNGSRKNIAHIFGYGTQNISDVNVNKYKTTNGYGTKINTTTFNTPDTLLIIEQSQAPNTTVPSNYQNGYVVVGTDNLIFEKTYNVSFKISNITNNLLNIDYSKYIRILVPDGTAYSIDEIVGNTLIFKDIKFNQNLNTPIRQGFEIRICGMSFTLSEFMVTPVDEDNFEYEPYQGNIYSKDWSSDVGTIYGGYVDLISGELVEEYGCVKLEDLNWTTKNNNRIITDDLSNSILPPSYSVIVNIIGEQVQPASYSMNLTNYPNAIACSSNGQLIKYYDGENPQGLMAYQLKTPITHQLTPTQLQSFVGQNNFWSNADYVEIEYELKETEDIQKCRKKIMLNQPHTESVIGDVANFTTNMKAPLKECKVYFSPIQEGSGDPSPDNVRNIIGWNEVSVYHYGENLIPKTFPIKWYLTYPSNGQFVNANSYSTIIIPVPKGIIRVEKSEKGYITYCALCDIEPVIGTIAYKTITMVNRYSYNFDNSDGHKYLALVLSRSIQTDNNWDTFLNINPSVTISSTNVDFTEPIDGMVYPLNWSDEVGTVYGGYVDLAKGELVGTHTYQTFDGDEPWSVYGSDVYRFALQPSNGFPKKKNGQDNVICDSYSAHGYNSNYYVALSGTQALYPTAQDLKDALSQNPVHACYELLEPVHYQLTPQQLLTFKGENNIWSDTNGQTEVKFWTH